MSEYLVEVEHLKQYFQVRSGFKNMTLKAVDDVSFCIKPGETLGLVGESGCGKTTVGRSLLHLYNPTGGTVRFEGEEVTKKNIQRMRAKMQMVFQDPYSSLDPRMTAEDIIGEPLDVHHLCANRKERREKVISLMELVGLNSEHATRYAHEFSGGQRQRIGIARALAVDPKFIVCDEPVSALDVSIQAQVLNLFNRLQQQYNLTYIFISHDLPEILDKSDTITILRDGVYIDTVKSADVNEDDLKKLMVGREVTGDYYRSDYGEKVSDEVVLSVKNVTVPGLIEDISFDLHKGEILGFGGLSESGMHEIGKAIFGASYDREGEVVLADGTHINDIPTAIKHSIAYTSKDRDNESVVLNQSIGDNICLPSLDELANKAHILSDKKRREFADKYAKQMSVKMNDVNQFVSNLSGGNKQKVVLARWIGKDSDIVVLDSPTRGIDIKVKQDIYQLMNQMRKNGKSIIMISEELMELIGMSDRIIIMKDGKISGELERNQNLDENGLISMMV